MKSEKNITFSNLRNVTKKKIISVVIEPKNALLTVHLKLRCKKIIDNVIVKYKKDNHEKSYVNHYKNLKV